VRLVAIWLLFKINNTVQAPHQKNLTSSSKQHKIKLILKGEQTNLDAVAKDIRVINKIVDFRPLVTDGNQTTGNDYVYNLQVSLIVLGDTTKVLDLKINQLNVNKM
jgi:hypothetical protein